MPEEEKQELQEVDENIIEAQESKENQGSLEEAKKRASQAAESFVNSQNEAGSTKADEEGKEPTPQGEQPTGDDGNHQAGGDELTLQDRIDSIASDHGLTMGQASAIRRHPNPDQLIAIMEKSGDGEFIRGQANVLKQHYDKLSSEYGKLGQAKKKQSQEPEVQNEPPPSQETPTDEQKGFDPQNPYADIDAREDLPDDVKALWKQDRQRYLETMTQQSQSKQEQAYKTINEWKRERAGQSTSFKEYFGVDDIRQMDPNSDQGKRLKAVINTASRMASNNPEVDPKQHLDAALSIHESEIPVQMTVDRIRNAAEQQTKKVIGAGSQGSRPEPTDEQKAYDKLEAKRESIMRNRQY